jgi:hypothetical protein
MLVTMGERKNYIITVGIDEYQHPKLDKFNCCVKDCESLVKILSEDYGFEKVKGSYGRNNKKDENKILELFDTDADYESIRSLFENLVYHPEFQDNTDIRHNLIIYFSGHGLIDTETKGSWFYWVPNDYKGDLKQPERRDLYSMALDLVGNLIKIRYQNLLIISDSCNSAGVLHRLNFFDTSTKSDVIGCQRSAWALCSSASDQPSKAGKQSSLFTGMLIDELKKNVFKDLDMVDLFRKVSVRLDGFSQQAFHERLNIIPDNTGYFTLAATQAKVKKILSQKIEQQLQSGLESVFNYVKEKQMICDLEDPMEHICAIISGTSEQAPHLLLKILLSNEFLSYDRTTPPIDPLKALSDSGMPGIVLNMFRLANFQVASEDDLVQSLFDKLNTAHFLIKIIFPEDMTDRAVFVKEIERVMARVKACGPTTHKLIVIIVDDEGTKYQQDLLPGQALHYYFMDEIGTVTTNSFKNWYTIQRTRYGEQELQDFLDSNVKGHLNDIVGTGDKFPATVVRNICTNAGCQPLADKILTIK